MTDLATQHANDRLADYAAAFIATWRSEHTRRAYRAGVASWLDWCRRHDIDPLNTVAASGQLWMAELADAGYADGTRTNRLSAARSFYEWMETQDIPFRRNPAKLTRNQRPKANPVPTPALSAEQVVAILDAADADSPRAAAIVWTLVTTGLRVGELLSANLDDIGVDQGHTVLTVLAKGRKRHTVVIVPSALARINAYRAGRTDDTRLPATTAGARPSRPLFATEAGRRIYPAYIRQLLQRLAVKAELPAPLAGRLGPHVLRASFVSLNLAAGKDLRTVQHAVGHADPRTTEGYDRSHLSPDSHPSYGLMAVISAARARTAAPTPE